MSPTTENLNAISLDTLREIGNIGAGNAMTALAAMLDQTVAMSVPQVGLVSLSQFTQMAGGPEALSVGIYMPVMGAAPGHVAFLLPETDALRLADRLLGRSLGTTAALEELERSALMEVGNIMASSYLVALCELTGLSLAVAPPALAMDMTAAILSNIASTFASAEDRAITIVTRLQEERGVLDGFFIYVPEPGSHAALLDALRMDG